MIEKAMHGQLQDHFHLWFLEPEGAVHTSQEYFGQIVGAGHLLLLLKMPQLGCIMTLNLRESARHDLFQRSVLQRLPGYQIVSST